MAGEVARGNELEGEAAQEAASSLRYYWRVFVVSDHCDERRMRSAGSLICCGKSDGLHDRLATSAARCQKYVQQQRGYLIGFVEVAAAAGGLSSCSGEAYGGRLQTDAATGLCWTERGKLS